MIPGVQDCAAFTTADPDVAVVPRRPGWRAFHAGPDTSSRAHGSDFVRRENAAGLAFHPSEPGMNRSRQKACRLRCSRLTPPMRSSSPILRRGLAGTLPGACSFSQTSHAASSSASPLMMNSGRSHPLERLRLRPRNAGMPCASLSAPRPQLALPWNAANASDPILFAGLDLLSTLRTAGFALCRKRAALPPPTEQSPFAQPCSRSAGFFQSIRH